MLKDGTMPSKAYTRLDRQERYDLGTCSCTPDEQVELIDDRVQAEMIIASRLARHRARMQARDELDPKRVERRKAASKTANDAKKAKREDGVVR